MEQNSSNILKEVKSWITPALLSFVSMMLYQNMQEMKGDIKTLLNQSAQDKVRIDNLQDKVLRIEDFMFNKNQTRETFYEKPGLMLFKEEEQEIRPVTNA
jgi:hypothetical protein